MPVEQPFPDVGILQEEYLLIQAWKKTVRHIRAHNWFADHLEIDRASANLPSFLAEIASRFAKPDEYETRPLRLIPAPKSQPWKVEATDEGEAWIPCTSGSLHDLQCGTHQTLPIRPLAHVDLQDQVAATAILLCLADSVEARQGDPRGSLTDPMHRRRVISYGNRLLCDSKNRRMEHRWGSSALYRSYFQDYRSFVARPDVVAEETQAEGERIVIVHSDLKNFYDRVRPAMLSQRLWDFKSPGHGSSFYELASRVLRWAWDPRDKSLADEYASQNGIEGFSEIALPQGLAAAGFFSNVVLFRFDRRIRRAFYRNVAPGVQLLDVARYVDDLRIVLKVTPAAFDLEHLRRVATEWVADRLKPDAGLLVSEDKTQAAEYNGSSGTAIIRQADRMSRIQKAVSGGFDIAGGETILRAVLELLQFQTRYSKHSRGDDANKNLPITDVPDGTVSRFSANRVRTAYRWLRPLLPDPESHDNISSTPGGHTSEPKVLDNPPLRTRAELDSFAETLANEWIEAWVIDPSNIRTLRTAFDIWPAAPSLRRVLDYLERYTDCPCDCAAKRIALYCLSDLLRAGATETGLVAEPDLVGPSLQDYRDELLATATRILRSEAASLPWYLTQQALLFFAAYRAPATTAPQLPEDDNHYATLVRFLDKSNNVSNTADFATYAVLARRSFMPDEVIPHILPHLTSARLKKIAELDPSLAIECIDEQKELQQLLPQHTQRDLLLRRSPSSLATLVLGSRPGDNPFRDDLAILQFAVNMLVILRTSTSYTITPSDLEVTIPDRDPWKIRSGVFDVHLRDKRTLKGSIYTPPYWCEPNDRWRFQLGYLMRFILTGAEDFTAPVRSPHWKELQGGSYRPTPPPWRMRRYGLYNAHEAFGDRWLPITDWTTNLLLGLLAWPGSRRPTRNWLKAGIDETITALERRIDDMLALQGGAQSELLLPIGFDPPAGIQSHQSLHAVVVQPLLPDFSWFQPGSEPLTLTHRRRLRSHLASALSAVLSSMRVRDTHTRDLSTLDFLILPELSVHVDDLGILKRFAIAHKTIILAGLVYHSAREGDGQKLVNSAVWVVPQKTSLDGYQIRMLDQGKHQLSPAEEAGDLKIREFRTSQWLIGYRWSADRRKSRFWLTASVCFDATNEHLTADLTGKTDLYAIAAWNKDVATFDNIMQDNYRMYQMVVVANHGSIGGSGAYAPYSNKHRRRVFHTYGQQQAAISHVIIDSTEAFVERDTGSSDFKPPPAGWHRNRKGDQLVRGE